ncbi:MAG TPA: polyprenyl synthetase family protein [Syntrophales bacterium]|nr:polyprenyl synthetase family protein [Syntrophales bacterium]HPQ43166.1 polyprenyl synthetase family protein [Syntrophales bacterium]
MKNRIPSLEEYLETKKNVVDRALDEYLPELIGFSAEISDSMRYTLFAGGKRIRPVLCMASAEAVGGSPESVIPVACAIEMIHTYSLIHDDLPSMDNDDYRRGKPSNHKAFGEGVAVLAGDALLTEAFYLMSGKSSRGISPEKNLAIIHEISEAAGFRGMIGGQVADLRAEGKNVDMETVDYIHTHKTQALITVSIRAGAIIADACEDDLNALTEYGEKTGLAFQIADDILDIESCRTILGKDTGSDEGLGKATYPALIGLKESKARMRTLVEDALDAIRHFDEKAEPLRMIARFIAERKS